MPIRSILLMVLVFCTPLLTAQPTAPDDFLVLHLDAPTALNEKQAIPLQATPFLSFSIKWKATNWDPERQHFEARFSSDGENWGDWMPLPPSAHSSFEHPEYLSELYFADAAEQFFQLRIQSQTPILPETLETHFFNPGKTPNGQTPTVPLSDRTFCPCPQPEYMARLDWCPTGDCPIDATPSFTTVSHLIVHHSAGSNTSSDWAARVRSIWNGHVNGNGWDDIGYNWLIDPNGVLYQGRGNNVLGAHFCGTNGGTMGVCMIGTYTDVLPTPEAINTLKELLAWKACLEDINPLDFEFHNSSGLNLFNISGHRDGCATECPGELFYGQLDLLRDTVAHYIANDCSPIPGPNNLTAAITQDTVVELAWQDYTDDEIAFELFRSPGGADDFQLLVTLPENTTDYNDLGLIPVEGYDYMVRAVNDTIASGFSNVASVMPIISGLEEVENPMGLELFPNPTTDRIQLTFDRAPAGAIQIRLIAADSRRLYKTFDWPSSVQGASIDLAGLPQGLYFVEVRSAEATVIKRVLKL